MYVKLCRLIPPLCAAIATTCLLGAALSVDATAATERSSPATTSSARGDTGSKKVDDFESQPVFSGSERSQRSKRADASEKRGSGGAIGRMLFGLIVVVGVIYLVHWLLKHYNRSRLGERSGGASSAIEIVATTPLAAGRALHVVRVGGEYLLLGATDSSITNLRAIDPAAPGMRANGAFEGALDAALVGDDDGVKVAARTADGFMGRVVKNLQVMTAR